MHTLVAFHGRVHNQVFGPGELATLTTSETRGCKRYLEVTRPGVFHQADGSFRQQEALEPSPIDLLARKNRLLQAVLDDQIPQPNPSVVLNHLRQEARPREISRLQAGLRFILLGFDFYWKQISQAEYVPTISKMAQGLSIARLGTKFSKVKAISPLLAGISTSNQMVSSNQFST